MPRKMKGTRVTPEMVSTYTGGEDRKKESGKASAASVKDYKRPGQPGK